MPAPIHLADGTYQLANGAGMVFDLNVGQDTVSVTNNTPGPGSFRLSVNHSPAVTHNLAAGTSFNLTDQPAGTHIHIDNTGPAALEVDIA